MRSFFIALLMLQLGGCATLIEGTSQNVAVVTQPPGASCVMERDGKVVASIASTPGAARLDKSAKDVLITCSKNEFQPVKVTNSPHFVGTTIGNVIAGGLVGVIVDASSGANNAYIEEVHTGLDLANGVVISPATVHAICPPAGMKISGDNSVRLLYKGADPADPDVCLHERANVVERRYFAYQDPDRLPSPVAREAVRAVFSSPAGLVGRYELDDTSGHWTHALMLAEPEVLVVDRRLVRAIRLVDEERNTATGAEIQTTYLIDPTNGLPLKRSQRQTINGQVTNAEWKVTSISRE